MIDCDLIINVHAEGLSHNRTEQFAGVVLTKN